MNKRPRSITVIGVIFIAFGGIALLSSLLDAASTQNLAEFKAKDPSEYAPVFVLRVLALLCGVFILYGFNWARWLLGAWLGYHIIIGFLHSPWSGFVHFLLFSTILYFLFRPQASVYFRGLRACAKTNARQ